MQTKTLDFHFEAKALDGAGTFEGHASVFGVEDYVRDTVKRGAFKRTLAEHATKDRMPALLWQHDTHQPIGVWEEMREDRRGLFAQGRLLIDDIPQARAAHALLKEGGLSGLSIGFRTVESEVDDKRGVRKLTDVDLFEVSLVTFPALDSARVEAVKEISVEDIMTKTELEGVLRDVGLSRSVTKYIVAGWMPPAQRNVEGDVMGIVDRLNSITRTLAA
jgi:HK97 family phage prohead protease